MEVSGEDWEQDSRQFEGSAREGFDVHSVSRGSSASSRLKRVGMEGPKMSVSRMPLRRPRRVNARARFAVVELLGLGCAVYECCDEKSGRGQ